VLHSRVGSLALLTNTKACLRQFCLLRKSVNYGPNKFNDTAPECCGLKRLSSNRELCFQFRLKESGSHVQEVAVVCRDRLHTKQARMGDGKSEKGGPGFKVTLRLFGYGGLPIFNVSWDSAAAVGTEVNLLDVSNAGDAAGFMKVQVLLFDELQSLKFRKNTRIFTFVWPLLVNGRAHIWHQCRKTTVLKCHRCLLSS
jgi:hypothetical protein